MVLPRCSARAITCAAAYQIASSSIRRVATLQSRRLSTSPLVAGAKGARPPPGHNVQAPVVAWDGPQNPTDVFPVPPDSAGKTVRQVLVGLLPRRNYPSPLVARLQDGKVLSLNEIIPQGTTTIKPVAFGTEDPAAREAFWLSTGYLLGMAIQIEMKDRALLTGCPSLPSAAGLAYEFLPLRSPLSRNEITSKIPTKAILDLLDSHGPRQNLSKDMVNDIQRRVRALYQQDFLFVKDFIPLKAAKSLFKDNPFKLDLIDSMGTATIPIVRIGDNFVDLLPNAEATIVTNSRIVCTFEVLQTSSVSWVPASPVSDIIPPSTQPLIRVRGISFDGTKRLDAYNKMVMNAERSDHRLIGKQQTLFMTHKDSPGTPFILPHGMRVARKIERVIRDLYDVYGYDEVQSPQLYKSTLWQQSGHWENYKEDMFSVKGYQKRDSPCPSHGEEAYGLKPMNCPGHCLIFANEEHSYRDLPLRYAEFSPLHRNEPSGSLSGLTRVRRFHQDDAHVFCTPQQVEEEINTMLKMLEDAYRPFGFGKYEVVLSTRPSAFIGEVEEWDLAEKGLRRALDSSGRKWEINKGDGAFYGPKIDIRLVDASGKRHQTATIQLDFQLPRRFDLKYTDQYGVKVRPVMIHRAILGSVERFMAILIEKTEGRWPFWLSPRQVVVIPVADAPHLVQYAKEVQTYLATGGTDPNPFPRPTQRFHVDLYPPNNSLQNLIKKAHLARYNYTVIVGSEEVKTRTINVRIRSTRNIPDRFNRKEQTNLKDLRTLFCKLDSENS